MQISTQRVIATLDDGTRVGRAYSNTTPEAATAKMVIWVRDCLHRVVTHLHISAERPAAEYRVSSFGEIE